MCDGKKKRSILPIEVKPGMRIKMLSNPELEQIQEATLSILEQTGVRFPSKKALKIFADAGAQVDFNTQRVKLSPYLLEKTLAQAPRAITMASSGDPDLDLRLDGTKVYYGTDGTGIKTVDFETRQVRASKKEDVAKMAVVADYLPQVSFIWPMVSAQDMPPATIPLHELEACFTNTEKHVHIISCVEEKAAQHCVEMAKIVAGGSEEARKRPPLSLLVCTGSPLGQDPGALEAALVFAEAGLPVGFMAMPTMCSTAPASIAGALLIGNVEVLSALCLIQLAFPGTPSYYAVSAEMMNPYSGKCLGGSFQRPLLNVGRVELGHYNNFPVMGYYGSTGSRKIDWIAGKESSIDALFMCLSGPEVLPALGILETYTLLYPEKILFDIEIFNSVKGMTEGISVNTKSLSVDEIMSVGPGGHFLNREQTRDNLKELWKPGIVHQWDSSLRDFRDPGEVAREKIRWILQNHKPRLLEEKKKEELRKIIQSAEKMAIFK